VTKRIAQATVRLMVVHDHPGVRMGLTSFFGHEPDMEVVSATTCGEHVVDVVAALRPDMVLMQRSWGGIEAARRLIVAHPETLVTIVSASADAQCRAEAARSGAVGVVDLTAPPSEIAAMLRRLVRVRANAQRS
jgi:DNA-binding NarL/FixJ family response regulator